MSGAERFSLVIFVVLAGLFFFFEIIVLLGFLRNKAYGDKTPLRKRKWVRITAAAAAFLALAAIADAFFIEPDWVVEERLAFVSEKIKSSVRIVQISDLHMEGFGKRHEKALNITRAAKPDIIVLTGDYLNGNRMEYLPDLLKFVKGLDAPRGIYAIEGNFEFSQNPAEALRKAGVVMLCNDSVRFDDIGLNIAGLRCTWDLRDQDIKFLRETEEAGGHNCSIILSHYPNHIEEPELSFADIYLCGHTHGGQVRVPLWGAVVTLSKLGKKYECGHYEYGDMEIYVNRGIGMEDGAIPRVRFLCRPEVTVINISPSGTK